jgi:hypothetical protein
LEADLRSVDRLIEGFKAASRCDHPAPRPQRLALEEDPGEFSSPKPIEPPPKTNVAAWTFLSLGLAAFACGAVLLGWSFAAEREDLWPIGMPLALLGQAGLIVGLVMQCEGLWQSSRRAAQTLDHLDEELDRIRHATTLLATSKSGSSQSFYAHLAAAAPPEMLLADVKGQLDQLARQMSRGK